ncbi:MAG: AAA family ATPase [Phycisphaerae bacterium]
MSDKMSTVSCPECGRTYDVSGLSAGTKARCKCGCKFDVSSGRIVEQGMPPPATSVGRPQARLGDTTNLGSRDALEAVESLAQAKDTVLDEVGKIIIGQKEVLDQILTAFFARGHCLLMGVPGLAKTMMVHCLAQTMLLDFKRIQFTPDLMPTDITGTNILQRDPDTRQRRFVFQKGPIFTNVLLADEINRTPPKTQAALLEAMQERKVTSSGHTHTLPEPFLVLATQNPIELEGTYPLPEAQLDRFILLIKVDYPDLQEEQQILLTTTGRDGEPLDGILDAKSVLRYQDLVRQVPISEHVAKYAARLCRATRPQSDEAPEFISKFVRYGCGPRAGQSLILAAKAHVVLNGRFNVSCDDIRKYALPVLRHRVILNFAAASEGLDTDAVIKRLLDTVGESE